MPNYEVQVHVTIQNKRRNTLRRGLRVYQVDNARNEEQAIRFAKQVIIDDDLPRGTRSLYFRTIAVQVR